MKKLFFIFLLLPICLFSQDTQDGTLREIDWKTYVENVIYLTDSTYQFDASPIDFNDKGSWNREIGNYFVDFVGHRYLITGSDATTITILDEYRKNVAPQSGQVGRVYQSVLGGYFKYVGGVDITSVDDLSRWKIQAADNEILAQKIQEGRDSVVWGDDYVLRFYMNGVLSDSVLIDTVMVAKDLYPIDTISFNNEGIDSLGFIILDNNYSVTESEPVGTMYWDDENDTYSIVTNNNVYQAGQELAPLFKNVSGRTMYNGEIAYYAGGVGSSEHIEFTSAALDGTFLPSRIIGILTGDVADNAWGKVTWFGGVRNININDVKQSTDGTWNVDDILYASNTEESKMTNVMPDAPNYAAEVCVIVSINGDNITVYTRPTWNWKLANLADVNGTPLTESGQIPVWNQDSSYFDFDYNINSYVPDSIWDNINSSARLWGGVITDNGDGTVHIDRGAGLSKTINADPESVPQSINGGQASELYYVSWDEVTSLPLTDMAYNYIYYDGSLDAITTTTDFYSISFTQDFTIGRAYREGTDIVVRLCGTNAWNYNRRIQLFGEEVFPVIRAKGLIIAETGTLQFNISSGILWAEAVNRFSVGAFNGTTTPFYYYYRDGVGGWTKVSSTAIDNVNYDDGSGVLSPLIAQRYGVNWVFEDHEGTVYVVYGRDSYTETDAVLALIPSDLPGVIDAYSTLIGKIIVQKNSTTFYSVQSAFQQQFAFEELPQQVHNDMIGLDGGEPGYYGHLTIEEQQSLDTIGINASLIDSLFDDVSTIRDTTEALTQAANDFLDTVIVFRSEIETIKTDYVRKDSLNSYQVFVTTNGVTNYPIPFTLESHSLVFYNGAVLDDEFWLGVGTMTLILDVDIKVNDIIKILK